MVDFKFTPEAQIEKGEKMCIHPIKGYATQNGYMGYVGGRYILFPTEDEYISFVRENIKWGI